MASATSSSSSRVNFSQGDNEVGEKEKKPRNINRTAKYNRKEMRMRLQVEEWMDRQLRDLYECEEDEEYPVEIDIDELIELSEAERCSSIQETLRDATQPSEEFIKQLLLKIQNYQTLKQS